MSRNDNYREEFLSKLEWRTSKSSTKSKEDVSISITKDDRLNFTFRNACEAKLSSTGYFTICVHKNRILFKEMPTNTGFKLCNNKKNACNNVYAQVRILSEADRAFSGNYELKYDEFLELHYIER